MKISFADSRRYKNISIATTFIGLLGTFIGIFLAFTEGLNKMYCGNSTPLLILVSVTIGCIVIVVFASLPLIKDYWHRWETKKINNLRKKIFWDYGKKRIAILLPIEHSGDSHYRDELGYAFLGIALAQKKLLHQFNGFEFVYFDHKNDPAIARNLIIDELNRGTRLFLCTMSKVCIELSNNDDTNKNYFGRILKDYEEQKELSSRDAKAVLVCTLATSSYIKCEKNLIYRFFISANHEAIQIISDIRTKINPNNKHNIAIVFNQSGEHSYAQEATETFKEVWEKGKYGNISVIPTDFKTNSTHSDLIERVLKQLDENYDTIKLSKIIVLISFSICTEKFLEWFADKADADPKTFEGKMIVIPSIFPGLDEIISGKKELGFQAIKRLIINKVDVFYSRPQKKNDTENQKNRAFYGEVAEYFTMAALYRLIDCSSSMSNITDFHNKWANSILPKSLEISSRLVDSGDPEDPRILTKLTKLELKNKENIVYDD